MRRQESGLFFRALAPYLSEINLDSVERYRAGTLILPERGVNDPAALPERQGAGIEQPDVGDVLPCETSSFLTRSRRARSRATRCQQPNQGRVSGTARQE